MSRHRCVLLPQISARAFHSGDVQYSAILGCYGCCDVQGVYAAEMADVGAETLAYLAAALASPHCRFYRSR
jgi:hypothetical protein